MGGETSPRFDIVSVNDLKINYMCGMCLFCGFALDHQRMQKRHSKHAAVTIQELSKRARNSI